MRANALALPLPDASVDLIVTSPPYFALRSYRDDGSHYEGQIGSEPTPAEFLQGLWAATREMVRVLRLSGSIWVNLGDKYVGSGNVHGAISNWGTAPLNGGKPSLHKRDAASRGDEDYRAELRRGRFAPNYGGIPTKSLMGMPWRYAIGCIGGGGGLAPEFVRDLVRRVAAGEVDEAAALALIDAAAVDAQRGLGLILRAEVVWEKPNVLPESVTDRVRRSHEQWFHLVKAPRYYAAIDEIRERTGHEADWGTYAEAYMGTIKATDEAGRQVNHRSGTGKPVLSHPLGKAPGSVWSVPSEALHIPEWARTKYGLPDHFAAFPQEWPRKLILGFSPPGVCTACGEGRRPVSDRRLTNVKQSNVRRGPRMDLNDDGFRERGMGAGVSCNTEMTILGYACACTPHTDHPGTGGHDTLDPETGYAYAPDLRRRMGDQPRVGPWREYHLDGWQAPHTTPAVVLDPFGGTGTVAMVAASMGRWGISVDLSSDYCDLARWRIEESGHAVRSEQRTWKDRQGVLL